MDLSSHQPIWLDCDPGHDDATAILLALHTPHVRLLGVSTVAGNAPAHYTAANAARLLVAFGAPPDVSVYPGATNPLIVNTRHDPEIHGEDGLAGVVGLPTLDDPRVRERFAREGSKAIEGIASSARGVLGWNASRKGSERTKMRVIATGPLTNVALFVSVYPELLDVVEIVFMGGGIGLGNRSSAAEFNILCDPHAAQIVLNTPVRKVMIPLNTTHIALVTPRIHSRVLSPTSAIPPDPSGDSVILPKATSPLRAMLSTLLSHFASAYRTVFGFSDPPLHDALTIAFVAHPELFKLVRYKVNVELAGAHTTGETIADLYGYEKADESWGPTGRNCEVAMGLEADKFFEYFLECVNRCDLVSPLNETAPAT